MSAISRLWGSLRSAGSSGEATNPQQQPEIASLQFIRQLQADAPRRGSVRVACDKALEQICASFPPDTSLAALKVADVEDAAVCEAMGLLTALDEKKKNKKDLTAEEERLVAAAQRVAAVDSFSRFMHVPLQQATASKKTSLQVTALSAYERLASDGFLRGAAPAEETLDKKQQRRHQPQQQQKSVPNGSTSTVVNAANMAASNNNKTGGDAADALAIAPAADELVVRLDETSASDVNHAPLSESDGTTATADDLHATSAASKDAVSAPNDTASGPDEICADEKEPASQSLKINVDSDKTAVDDQKPSSRSLAARKVVDDSDESQAEEIRATSCSVEAAKVAEDLDETSAREKEPASHSSEVDEKTIDDSAGTPDVLHSRIVDNDGDGDDEELTQTDDESSVALDGPSQVEEAPMTHEHVREDGDNIHAKEPELPPLASRFRSDSNASAESGSDATVPATPRDTKSLLVVADANTLGTAVVKAIGACFENTDVRVQRGVVSALRAVMLSPICGVHGRTLMAGIRTCINVFLVSRHVEVRASAKAALKDVLSYVFHQMEHQMLPEVIIGDEGPEPERVVLAELVSAEELRQHIRGQHVYSDCYTIFRALCKLAMKDTVTQRRTSIASTPTAPEAVSTDLRLKLVSLELLHEIVFESGPVFQSWTRFIHAALKRHLALVVLTNGGSPNAEVFRWSLAIFLVLVRQFKDYHKAEIGVFYSRVLLHVMESNTSSLEHKWLVLQCLRVVCGNPQMLVDVFVNYDCDLSEDNLFERMANSLATLAHTTGDGMASGMGKEGPLAVDARDLEKLQSQQSLSTDSGDFIEAAHQSIQTTAGSSLDGIAARVRIHMLALESLVMIMRSLVRWTRQLRDDAEKRTAEAIENTDSDDLVPDRANSQEDPGASSQPHPGTNEPDFHSIKDRKTALSQGIQKFNMHPKHGMRALIAGGFVADDPEAIAHFLKSQKDCERAMVGEYIGDVANEAVMHAFVDSFQFRGQLLDIALRRFLLSFRLPGEAQKIDRIMEKFADRYFSDHTRVGGSAGMFKNADAVYVLSFATVMLATDLHSPSIKDKMTFDSWVSIQRGSNDGGDYDRDYLLGVFKRIAAEPLRVETAGGGQTGGADNVHNHAQRWDVREQRARFATEMNSIIESSRQLLRQAQQTSRNASSSASSSARYYRAKQMEHVKPMFDVVWAPLLAALSILLEQCAYRNRGPLLKLVNGSQKRGATLAQADDDEAAWAKFVRSPLQAPLVALAEADAVNCATLVFIDEDLHVESSVATASSLSSTARVVGADSEAVARTIVRMSLVGLLAAIRISCTFMMDVQRNAIVTAVAKFTYANNMREMTQKNVDCIGAMLSVARTEANYLRDSWTPILRCVSQLEQLYMVGQGASAQALPQGMQPDENIASAPALSMIGGTVADFVLPNAALVCEQVDWVAIERIFTASARLSDSAVLDFMSALAQVSLEEIKGAGRNPRTFSLQKMVEFTHTNNGDQENRSRLRITWQRIWRILSEHFAEVGCSSDIRVASYAIDSLRQMAHQLLSRSAESNFEHQQAFLTPFISILDPARQPKRVVRDLALQVLRNIIEVHGESNLRSGWKGILSALAVAAAGEDDVVVRGAFDVAQLLCCANPLASVEDFEPSRFLPRIIVNGMFADLIQLLSAFAANAQTVEINLRALDLLVFCASQINCGTVRRLMPERSLKEVGEEPSEFASKAEAQTHGSSDDSGSRVRVFTLQDIDTAIWEPLLLGLAHAGQHTHVDVRTAALGTLFDRILRDQLVSSERISRFDAQLWEHVFRRVLLPLFASAIVHDTAESPDEVAEREEWLTTTCLSALNALCSLFSDVAREMLAPDSEVPSTAPESLLDSVLGLLRDCIMQTHSEALAHAGSTCLLQLSSALGNDLNSAMWTALLESFCTVLHQVAADSELLSVGSVVQINTDDLTKSATVVALSPRRNSSVVRRASKRIARHQTAPELDTNEVTVVSTGQCGTEEDIASAEVSAVSASTPASAENLPVWIPSSRARGRLQVLVGLTEALTDSVLNETHLFVLDLDAHVLRTCDALDETRRFCDDALHRIELWNDVAGGASAERAGVLVGLVDLLLKTATTAAVSTVRLLSGMFALGRSPTDDRSSKEVVPDLVAALQKHLDPTAASAWVAAARYRLFGDNAVLPNNAGVVPNVLKFFWETEQELARGVGNKQLDASLRALHERSWRAFEQVAAFALSMLGSLPDDQFFTEMRELHPLTTNLLLSASGTVRSSLRIVVGRVMQRAFKPSENN